MQNHRAFSGNARPNLPFIPETHPETKNPFSVTLESLPPSLRLPVLKSLGESGNGSCGLKSARTFMRRRKGSIAMLGTLTGDDDERRKEREFYEWLLAWVESYRQLFLETAHTLRFAEEHIDDVIDTLDKGIKTLEKPPGSGEPDLKGYKEEAEKFRDEELPAYKKILQRKNPPPPSELKEIRDTVKEKISRFTRIKHFAADKIREAATQGLHYAGGLASACFTCAAQTARNWRGLPPAANFNDCALAKTARLPGLEPVPCSGPP